MNLEDFESNIKKLSWDEFMTIYKIRDQYSEKQQKIICAEYSRRAENFNKYMSF